MEKVVYYTCNRLSDVESEGLYQTSGALDDYGDTYVAHWVMMVKKVCYTCSAFSDDECEVMY